MPNTTNVNHYLVLTALLAVSCVPPPQMEPTPTVVFLHGYGEPSEQKDALALEYWTEAAPEANILLLERDRLDRFGHRFWNGGTCCDFDNTDADDVAWIAEQISHLNRVWLVGYSNGGFMAHLIACERPDLLERGVSISGAPFPGCESHQVLEIHGDMDEIIPLSDALPAVNLEIIEGGNHAVVWLRRKLVTQLSMEWLRE